MPRNNIIPKLEYLAVFKSTFREEIPYLLFRVYYICLGQYERAQYFPTIDSNIITSECYKYFLGKPCTSISLD